MLCRTFPGVRQIARRFCTASALTSSDVQKGYFSPEWCVKSSGYRTVFRSTSTKGNGEVSIVSRRSSEPKEKIWLEKEEWLNKRYAEVSDADCQERFKVVGFEWRTLYFNEKEDQSKVKATTGNETLRILCIGLGGGSLPLFLANAIRGADIDIVEIDPLVISATFQEMGFPAVPVVSSSGECAFPEHNIINKMLWGDVEKRLHLYENDAAKFTQDTSTVYDMIFIDADDGEGKFPRHLWDRQFLKALGDRLHPEHGTVLVYRQSDDDDDQDPGSSRRSQIGREYKDVLVGNGSNCDSSGIGFIAEVDYGLATLVVSRGFWKEDSMDRNNKDSLSKILQSKTFRQIQTNTLRSTCHFSISSPPHTMLRRTFPGVRQIARRFCTASALTSSDVQKGYFSPEWWVKSSGYRTVFRSTSTKGNGEVSIVSRRSSEPKEKIWPKKEEWLNKRYAEVSDADCQERFKVVGFEWRTLYFNEKEDQSKVKVMAACRESEPGSVFLMQQPKRLHYQFEWYGESWATTGKETLRILCIGLGGGSLPLFLANAIQGADIDIVEIDPLEMGFPALPVVASSGECTFPEHNIINKMLWGDMEKRLHLYENDGAKFIQDTSTVYDMIFIDADDGEGEFPRHLWDRQFLKALGDRLHPEHGTVLVYLEPDDDGDQDPGSSRLSQIGREYKDVLVGNGSNCDSSGIGFIAEVDYGLATLVVSRGFWKEDSMDRNNKDSLKKILQSKTVELIKLPSSGIKLALKNYEEKPLTLID
ncbi:hypothetical protein Tsubulata_045376, partial [Turnera subulata]